MTKIFDVIRFAAAAIGGIVGTFVGEPDGFLYTLIAFAAIDYVTGVMVAVAEKTLSSKIGFKGICRKVLIFAMVGIGHLLDANILGGGEVLRTAVVFFYLANEGISVCENSAKIGLPIPHKLKEVLGQLKECKGDN